MWISYFMILFRITYIIFESGKFGKVKDFHRNFVVLEKHSKYPGFRQNLKYLVIYYLYILFSSIMFFLSFAFSQLFEVDYPSPELKSAASSSLTPCSSHILLSIWHPSTSFSGFLFPIVAIRGVHHCKSYHYCLVIFFRKLLKLHLKRFWAGIKFDFLSGKSTEFFNSEL